ncbi:hypothetical protein PVAP13_1NG430000 [Panicum virgatum]|uniref:Uncharacterized protein n=1 Tax=Panicum virgatum TaxID=38727 RepID=A0A8T0WV97_PANVG|nr:hypothetical protein PVAP13_1NG430000 [Panicum virgatum]
MLPETDESVFPGGAPISPIAITCAAFLLLHASDLPHVSKPQGHTTSLLSGLNSSPPVSPTLPPLPSLTSQAESSHTGHSALAPLERVRPSRNGSVCGVRATVSVCETSYDCTLNQSWGRHSYPPVGSKAMMIWCHC